MKSMIRLFILPLALTSFYSCSHQKMQEGETESPGKPKIVADAHVYVKDLKGKEIGHVVFKPHGSQGVLIEGEFHHLKPNSLHGIHVHEVGDCSGNFDKTGGHFNPAGYQHGKPHDHTHAGDLGNIKTDRNGKGTIKFTTDKLSINGGDHDALNRSLVIHENKDDYKSQPAGNSGKKIACGVIK